MRQLDGTGMKRLHREWRRRTPGRLALVLDGLGTPANVGAIVRSAAAYRAEVLWLAGPTPDLDGAGVQRTALGTDRYVTARRAASSWPTARCRSTSWTLPPTCASPSASSTPTTR